MDVHTLAMYSIDQLVTLVASEHLVGCIQELFLQEFASAEANHRRVACALLGVFVDRHGGLIQEDLSPVYPAL